MAITNWGGTYRYRAEVVHRPRSLDELREIVAGAHRLRVLGTRHAFTDIGDGPELVSLAELPGATSIDAGSQTVSVPGAMRYGELAAALDAEGWALANLASLPHISVAGAIATATHGSGVRNGNLATAVAGLELVRSDGSLVTLSPADADFAGAVVGLGALGAVTSVTLAIEPAYAVRQYVYEELDWEALYDHLDAVLSAAYSVSLFTRWAARIDQVWLKARDGESAPADLFGARPATVERHPILGLDPVNCTAQLGAAGPWMDRLPHFRLGFTPSAGDEIQSEYHLPYGHAVAALEELRGLAARLAPLVQVTEIRTIAADELWMSPQYRRDTLAVHFTWVADLDAVTHALEAVEAVLLPLGARPHWGKLFLAQAEQIAPRYERAADFAALARRMDPRGAFVNAWLSRVLLDAG
jgi:xylitol oxidase